MNKITKISSTLPLLLSVVLMVTISACSGAKTASDAPSSTDNKAQVSTADSSKSNQDDAQSETRKKQLNPGTGAAEQYGRQSPKTC
jgi:hyperosmotically inducible periplasmic protein